MTARTLRATLASVAVISISAATLGLLWSNPSWETTAKCPPGESEDHFTGICLPTTPTELIELTRPEYGGPPEVDGVPCTGHNSYECIGLAEEQAAAGPTPSPSANVSTPASTTKPSHGP